MNIIDQGKELMRVDNKPSAPSNLLNKVCKEMEKREREKDERQKRAQEAQIEMAENFPAVNDSLKKVIVNQEKNIETLEKNNREIVDLLRDIFASGEDSVCVQKEILKILQDQNPDKDLLKDKSLDMVIQMIFGAISIYLRSKGIEL